MSFQRFIDWLQVRCYLWGFLEAGHFFGRFATPALPTPTPAPPVQFRPDDVYVEPEPVTVEDLIPEIRAGMTWSLDELVTGPLHALDLEDDIDARLVDPEYDVVFPNHPLDIN